MPFTSIDLSRLPAPEVIEPLDYETILSDLKATAVTYMPDLEPVLALESEPATKILEVCAFHILLMRQRVNEAARAVMLAFASGADLDNLGALVGVERQIITPADEEAVPPVEAVMEGDASFRARIQLAPEAYTSAGSIGSYVYHALSADPLVKGAQVDSPEPGTVRVVVLSREAGGVPSAPVLGAVEAALSAEDVRPLCDSVIVWPAGPDAYSVEATIKVGSGPDTSVILAAAEAALAEYVERVAVLGGTASVSGIMAALHQEGVVSVDLTSPGADIGGEFGMFPSCTAIALTIEEV